jgi:hypothetical protein
VEKIATVSTATIDITPNTSNCTKNTITLNEKPSKTNSHVNTKDAHAENLAAPKSIASAIRLACYAATSANASSVKTTNP